MKTFNPWFIALGAVLRRFAALAGSALLTYAGVHWADWLREALQSESKLAAFTTIIFLVIEFVQKSIREHSKAKE